jgi:hypothetical protein
MPSHLTQCRPGDHSGTASPTSWNTLAHRSADPVKILAAVASAWSSAAGLGTAHKFPRPVSLTTWHRAPDGEVTTQVFQFRFDGTPTLSKTGKSLY